MTQSPKAERAIQEALDALERELNSSTCPEQGAMSRPQLLRFRETLQQMHQILQGNPPDSTEQLRPEGMSHIIVDSWPFSSKVGALILEAVQAFEAARKKKSP